jgi:hypothetical protein
MQPFAYTKPATPADAVRRCRRRTRQTLHRWRHDAL